MLASCEHICIYILLTINKYGKNIKKNYFRNLNNTMLRHIIMFKLKEFTNKTERNKATEILKEKLENLKTQILEIKKLAVGINIVEVPWAFDVVLTIDFENLKDFEIYKIHPAHQKFIEFNKNYSIAKSSVDYIITNGYIEALET